MKKTRLDRADGRYLYWYSFDAPPPGALDASEQARGDAQIELRWNALLGEWVIVSTARQGRTFLPPAEYCPLCPTENFTSFGTEIPSTSYEIAVFENRFPSFRPDAPLAVDESALEHRAAADGACEVIVYSPQHDASLASLPELQVRHLVDVWSDRYAELSIRPEVQYVFIFENRGEEIGVTLTHPHGQIYAFPFIPPRVGQEHRAAAEHHARTGRCLVCDVVASEVAHGARIVAEDEGFVAYVPFAARFPYEVHVAPVAHRPSLMELSPGQRERFARLLRTVQSKYDALWGFPMPYTMSMHQRAADGIARPGEHLHVEFMPPYRTKDRLKYLAGVETGAGTFINDTAPEEKAAELRAAAGA
ncbi:MAG: galactose-1-phosphate uridylyltransferase [Chloroflexota bacterium]|nr:galactose-1-phosphate uridylyltransferase [Chloroflexota bacterium]